MALDEEQFERISSTATFEKMLQGAVRRYQLLADLFGSLRVDTLMAGGVTFSDAPRPRPPDAGEPPTFERVMGREPVGFVDAPPKPPEEIEADDEKQRKQAAALALAQMQVYEATVRRDHPELIEGA